MSLGQWNVEHDGFVVWHVVDITGGGVHEDRLPVGPDAVAWEEGKKSKT